MKKHIIVLLFIICNNCISVAQSITPSVIPTAGDFFIQSSASLSWTMGETASELLTSAGSKISQGFQQPSFSNCTIKPAVPASITQVQVSNVCGQRVYRYTAAITTNAIGYAWTLPTSVGGVAGVSVDSGDILNSRIIKLKYVSNALAIAGDSIFVRAFSACGYSGKKAAKLTNTAFNAPAAPASITIQKITDVNCGKPRYRYIAPALVAATTTATAATGYDWIFTGTLGATAVIDSGTLLSKIFTVYFNSTAAAAISGDSVKLRYSSACGYSAYKASKLTNTLISTNPPLAPTSVTQTLVSDACGARVYRYIAPALPVTIPTATAATGYNWSLPVGTLGSTGVIDSGSLSCATCRIIRIKYSSNAGAVTGDSIGLKYTSLCGESPKKSFKLVVPVSPPIAPLTLTQTLVSNVCGARVYRYSTAVLPTGSSATGYKWSFKGSLFGTLGVNSFIDSGSLDLTSQTMRISYTSNAASGIGDSVKVQYNSACGLGAFKVAKMINTSLACLVSDLPATTKTNPININQTNEEIALYPNPSKNTFTLNLSSKGQCTILVYDLSGKIIRRIEKASGRFVFGEDLPTGMYLLKIFNGQKMVVKKIEKL